MIKKTDWKNIVLLTAAIAILVFTFSFHYFFQITMVIGDSMENTLFNKNYVLMRKNAFQEKDPQRFDIVIFPYEKEEDIYYIKRIIGLPGETVQIKNSCIYIDGKILNEEYGREAIDEGNEGLAAKEIHLKEQEYFVLGDNRNNSKDSRDASIGIIRKDKIKGKALAGVLPPRFLNKPGR